MKEITQDLELKKFPEIYNSNNTELLNRIQELSERITALETEKNTLRNEIILQFNTSLSQLQKVIDEKMSEYEKKFVMVEEPKSDSDSE